VPRSGGGGVRVAHGGGAAASDEVQSLGGSSVAAKAVQAVRCFYDGIAQLRRGPGTAAAAAADARGLHSVVLAQRFSHYVFRI
jgi:hypothetical protein